MIKVSKNYKKMQLTLMRMMFVIAVCCCFWMPGMIAFHEGGENYFTIYLNEAKIGATDSIDTIDEVMAQARRIIAGDSTDLLYARMDLEVEGKEVVFGKIDSQRTLLNRVAGVLVESAYAAQLSLNDMNKGIYLVKVGNKTRKVAVK